MQAELADSDFDRMGVPRRSPEEVQLTPLLTAVGSAGNEATARIYHVNNVYGRIIASSYRFG